MSEFAKCSISDPRVLLRVEPSNPVFYFHLETICYLPHCEKTDSTVLNFDNGYVLYFTSPQHCEFWIAFTAVIHTGRLAASLSQKKKKNNWGIGTQVLFSAVPLLKLPQLVFGLALHQS